MTRAAKALILAGLLLLAMSLGALLLLQLADRKAAHSAQALLQQLDRLLPPSSPGVPETYRVPEMPALEVAGQNIVAILEIPAFGLRLPVLQSWEQGSAHGLPRRFSGSAYDGSLIIGGSAALLACFAQIPNGTEVTVTDMRGAVFTYTVTRIGRSTSADPETLCGSTLTLFTRPKTSLEYILLRCD